jgi:hypothetical protein
VIKGYIDAIKIDPFACTVTKVQYDASDYKNMYPLMSHITMPVSAFTIAYIPILKDTDALFVDDEFLFKAPERWFMLATAHAPFGGIGIITGANARGDTISATTSLDLVRMSTIFFGAIHDELY